MECVCVCTLVRVQNSCLTSLCTVAEDGAWQMNEKKKDNKIK